VEVAGNGVDAETKRLHQLLREDLAGVDRVKLFRFLGHATQSISRP
jgi:hypothetical protein